MNISVTYWNSISNRQRKKNRRIAILITLLLFLAVGLDYFCGFNFFPFTDTFKWNPHAEYKDHIPSYFFFGFMATLGTVISFIVLITVSAREAKTLGEYLDIYNDILDDVKPNETFYILSPAHNTGQRDSYIDSTIKKKYSLNQKLLQKKSEIAKGEYTLLEFHENELSSFSDGTSLADRTKIIEAFNANPTQYSMMFNFVMKFSKQIEVVKKDQHTTQVQEYIQEAFSNLKKIKDKGLQLKTINSKDYLEAPLVLIISQRVGYFGLYKLTDQQSNAIVRGIKVNDKDGIETLMLLYNTYTKNSAKPVK